MNLVESKPPIDDEDNDQNFVELGKDNNNNKDNNYLTSKKTNTINIRIDNNNDDINSSDDGNNSKTKVFYGIENILEMQLCFSNNIKSKAGVCLDSVFSSKFITVEHINKMFLDCIKRGVKFRYITEITKDNIHYCKEIANIIGNQGLRHLDKVKKHLQ